MTFGAPPPTEAIEHSAAKRQLVDTCRTAASPYMGSPAVFLAASNALMHSASCFLAKCSLAVASSFSALAFFVASVSFAISASTFGMSVPQSAKAGAEAAPRNATVARAAMSFFSLSPCEMQVEVYCPGYPMLSGCSG